MTALRIPPWVPEILGWGWRGPESGLENSPLYPVTPFNMRRNFRSEKQSFVVYSQVKSGAPGTKDGQISFCGVRQEGPCLGPWGLHPSTWDPLQDWGHSAQSRTCLQAPKHVAAPGGAASISGAGLFLAFQTRTVVQMEEGQRFCAKDRKREKIDIYQYRR